MVVDCGVAAKWVLPEPGREKALRLLERFASGELLLIAPDLLIAEFASLLAKRTRRKELTNGQAAEAFEFMRISAPRLVNTRLLIPKALVLALGHQLSVWDSVYLALASEQECAVITADRRLFRSATARHPALELLQ